MIFDHSSSTFCLETKGGAKNSRQKIMLRIFCRASAREDPNFLKFSLVLEVKGRSVCALIFVDPEGAVFFAWSFYDRMCLELGEKQGARLFLKTEKWGVLL